MTSTVQVRNFDAAEAISLLNEIAGLYSRYFALTGRSAVYDQDVRARLGSILDDDNLYDPRLGPDEVLTRFYATGLAPNPNSDEHYADAGWEVFGEEVQQAMRRLGIGGHSPRYYAVAEPGGLVYAGDDRQEAGRQALTACVNSVVTVTVHDRDEAEED